METLTISDTERVGVGKRIRMQHIGLQRETEDGEVEAVYGEGKSIDLILLTSNLERTSCLRFIDPYGDTVFNQLQIPVLIEEIQAVVANAQESLDITEVIDFLKNSIDLHTHVRFCGD
ncbi:MAG: hypothetical protein JJU29_04275 [Verrucomicrobia bacterium]|nr:hypothetical protein [Verrucomicrobiota bacterium]MCH8512051.1 hypothetical protein [Kiritimatiellia bacterium]